jgi:hypothetical protein
VYMCVLVCECVPVETCVYIRGLNLNSLVFLFYIRSGVVSYLSFFSFFLKRKLLYIYLCRISRLARIKANSVSWLKCDLTVVCRIGVLCVRGGI